MMTINQYREWCKEQISPEDGLTLAEDDNTLHFQSEWAEGQVIFYEDDIVELIIVQAEQNVFYLHFQLHDDEHAVTLFFEMKNYLLSLKDKKPYHVLLTCTSAFTTGYFANELNKTADMMHMDMDFRAIPFHELYSVAANYDMILLSPQEAYEYENVREALPDQIVQKIPASIFARFQTGDLIAFIEEERRKQISVETELSKMIDIHDVYENNYRILTIGIANHHNFNQMFYRIYDHGHIVLDDIVIKTTFQASDLYDLIDVMCIKYRNIDVIGIALPGIVNENHIDFASHGFDHTNLKQIIEEKYNIPAFIINDANAVAVGYHATHEDTDNMVFYFQPIGFYQGGAGIILSGQLVKGRLGASGELKYLLQSIVTEGDSAVETSTGTLEVLSTVMRAFIATIAPEKIFFNCLTMPSVALVKQKLSETIPEEYIPEIQHLMHFKKYMLPGIMLECLTAMQNAEN